MYKFCFYVPQTHLEAVKSAVFATGAGQIGAYAECCWQVLGTGQFRPLKEANPFIGHAGDLTEVAEWKVELVVADEHIHAAVAAFNTAHPYEVPAFEVWRLSDLSF